MKLLILLGLAIASTAQVTTYPPAVGGGVNSVNGQTGEVLVPTITQSVNPPPNPCVVTDSPVQVTSATPGLSGLYVCNGATLAWVNTGTALQTPASGSGLASVATGSQTVTALSAAASAAFLGNAITYSQLGGTNPAAAGASAGLTALQPSGNGAALTGLSYSQLSGNPTSGQIATGLGFTPQNAATPNTNNAGIGTCTSGLFGIGTASGGTQPCSQVNYSQLGGTNPAAAGAALGATALQPAGNGSALTGLTNTQISGLGNLATQSAPAAGVTGSNGSILTLATQSQIGAYELPNKNTLLSVNAAGSNAGARIATQLSAQQAANGGIVDASGEIGTQAWTANPFSGITDPITLIPGGTGTINATAAVVVPGNVTMSIKQGTILSCSGGGSIAINGSILAGDYQIFDPACPIALNSNVTNQTYSLAWWGVNGNTADNSIYIAAASRDLWTNARGRTGIVPCGTYNFSTPQTIYTGSNLNPVRMVGSGKGCVTWNYNGSVTDSGFKIAVSSATNPATMEGLVLQSMSFRGGNTATYALKTVNQANAHLSDLIFSNVNSSNSSSACAFFDGFDVANLERIQCVDTTPRYGFVFHGGSVTTLDQARIAGPATYGLWLMDPSDTCPGCGAGNFVINELQQSLSARSLQIDHNWFSVTVNPSNIGESDTDTTEDVTINSQSVIFNNVGFLSAAPVHIGSQATYTAFNQSGLQNLTIDAGSRGTVLNDCLLSNSIIDNAFDTKITNSANNSTLGLTKNYAASQQRLGLVDSPGEFQNQPVLWSGAWYVTNASVRKIASPGFTLGSAWRAVLRGYFTTNSGGNNDANSFPYYELTEGNNTFTFVDSTVWTFAIDASTGVFGITSSSATDHGFIGTIEFFPHSGDGSTPLQSIHVPGSILAGPGIKATATTGVSVITAETIANGATPRLCLLEDFGNSALTPACIQSGGNGYDLEFLTSTSGTLTNRLTIPVQGGGATWMISQKGPSIAGTGTATATPQTGAGTGATAVCATSHICDSFSGEVTLTTGAVPAIGSDLLITLPITRTNQPNCAVEVYGGVTFLGVTKTVTTNSITINTGSPMAATTAYTIDYVCGGN